MGHGKSDRPFLSAAEHSGIYGAHSASSGKSSHPSSSSAASFHPVTYDCCALSFQPWRIPVCSPDCGVAFELTNLIPFLRKYSVHPITGKPFSLDDVVRLNFHTNDAGRFHDPVSMKEFGAHSHLVAIRQSGNVFLWETVQRLNVKAKYMKDLVSDEAFKKDDIITVQDPERPEGRDPSAMWHVKNGKRLTEEDRGIDTKEGINTSATAGSAQKVLSKLRSNNTPSEPLPSSSKSSKAAAKEPSTAYTRNKATGISTGMTAASFTSSSLTPRTAIDRVVLDNEEVMFTHIKSYPNTKAYVRLSTNFGPLNIELHCDRAPKTCYNFISLCKSGQYTDTIFHRNIPGFMIQGGDPTGTGRGGSSIWGTEFRDEYNEPGAYKHDGRGVLSMANKGVGTNGSQFFITYRAVPHLDGKHTVFGRLVDGEKDKTLAGLEGVPSEQGTDRPISKIKLVDVLVTEDPFERYQLKQRSANVSDPNDPEYLSRIERKRKRESDRTTWLGTQLPQRTDASSQAEATSKANEKKQAGLLATSSGSIGKYLDPAVAKRKSADNRASSTRTDAMLGSASNKRKAGGGFGDFSGW